MGQVDAPQFQNTSENSKYDLLTHFIKGKDCLKTRSFQNSVSRADMHRGLGRKAGWRANQQLQVRKLCTGLLLGRGTTLDNQEGWLRPPRSAHGQRSP